MKVRNEQDPYKNKKKKNQNDFSVTVIPLGLEPKTHALEGRCSNPAELRNHPYINKKRVIPLGLEPKTHALEGRCSNPAELRNHP